MKDTPTEDIEVPQQRPAVLPASQPRAPEADKGGGRSFFLTFGADQNRQYPVFEKQIEFVYRPIWDCSRQVVLTYLCQPSVPTPDEPSRGHSLCMAPGSEGDQSLLDLIVLREATAHVQTLHRAGFRLLIACPVHFNTIAVSRHWTEFSRILQATHADVLRDIAFLVTGISEGLPSARLAVELPKLTARTRYTFAVLSSAEAPLKKFANTGLHALGVEIGRAQTSHQQIAEQLQWVSNQARGIGLESFALGVRSTSIALQAIESGQRYLEGEAVMAAAKEPRHAYVHDLQDLYRPALSS
jgi:hypothetical protein